MVSKVQIHDLFKQIAENHKQIDDFGYGDLWEINTTTSPRYLLFWVLPIPCPVGNNIIQYRYQLFVADRVRSDESNELEVESDTFQVMLDILATLDAQDVYEWELIKQGEINPFTERETDRVTGHWLEISLQVAWDYDKCAVPIDGYTPEEPDFCAQAMVYVNQVLFNFVDSGAQINVPVQYENGTPVGVNEDGIIKIPDPVTCNPVTIQINGVFVDEEAAGGTANILNENTVSEPVGVVDGNGHVTIRDSELKINGDFFDFIPAEHVFDLPVKDTNGLTVGTRVGNELIVPGVTEQSGIVYQPPMLTRQYTSFDTNGVDDGGRIQSGFYDYTPPAYPDNFAQLDLSVSNYWFRLKNNNIFGNKFRFTDFDGLQVFPATSNKNAVFIDHLTGYMWIRRVGVGSFANAGRTWQGWINQIDALSFVVAGNTYNDWMMPSREECLSIWGNQPPANGIVDGATTILEVGTSDIWTSTTYPTITTSAWYFNSASQFANFDKGANDVAGNAICFRKHLW